MSEITKQIIYISDNINDLKLDFRKEILQIIVNSDIDTDKIIEKGIGTQLKFSDIDPILLKTIYNFIKNKIESNTNL